MAQQRVGRGGVEVEIGQRIHQQVVLPIELEDKLEGDLGRRLELSLVSYQVGRVHYGIQEVWRSLREHPEGQVS